MAHDKTVDKLAASVPCIVAGNCTHKPRGKLASSAAFTEAGRFVYTKMEPANM